MRKQFWKGTFFALLTVTILAAALTSSSQTSMASAIGEVCTTDADCAPLISSFSCRADLPDVAKQYHIEEYCKKAKKNSPTGTCQYKYIGTREFNCPQGGTTCDPDTGFCADKHLGCVGKGMCGIVDGAGPHTCLMNYDCN